MARPFENEMYVKAYANNMAPNSERQMPLYSTLGRGLRGNDAVMFIEERDEPYLVAKTFDYMTEEFAVTAELPLMSLCPKLHYKVWVGVENIDDVLWWVTYNEFICDIDIEDYHHEFWDFKTPKCITSQYFGSPEDIPEDHVIQEG